MTESDIAQHSPTVDPIRLAQECGMPPAIARQGIDIVTPAEMAQVSADLWGESEYGTYAAAHIDTLREDASGYVVAGPDRQAYVLLRDLEMNATTTGPVCSVRTTFGELRQAVWERMQKTNLPFESRIIKLPDGIVIDQMFPAIAQIIPSLVIRPRLDNFVRANHFTTQTLHESCGRTLATMVACAGSPPKQLTMRRQSLQDFVDLKEVYTGLRTVGVRTPRRHIDDKLLPALREQLRTGQPGLDGEIIVRGDPRQPTSIALGSLAVLAKQYLPQEKTAVRLREMAEVTAE